jgi:hypothetical protein
MARLVDKLAVAAFLLSIFCFGGVYGYLVHCCSWFPQQLIVDAEGAYQAWMQVEEEGRRPATFAGFDDGPVRSSVGGDAPSDEWILVTGGPYEFLEQCPTFGCLAWIMARDGTVIHSWEADLEEVFGRIGNVVGRTDPASFMPVGMHLLDDGGLLVVFQAVRAYPGGAGLARFDRDGQLVWYNDANMHHWFSVDPDGIIHVPMHEPVETPLVLGDSVQELDCPAGQVLLDFVVSVDPDGQVLGQVDILSVLMRHGYIGLVNNTADPCNPLHLNFVEYIGESAAKMIDGVEKGDLMISLRDVNTVLIFSPETGKIKWIESGRHVLQHSPRLLPDGSVLIFDNQGGARALGKSRIIRVNKGDADPFVLWPREPSATGKNPSTDHAGHISVSGDGKRALVSVTAAGAVLELDLETGQVLWRYDKRFSAERYPHANPQGQSVVIALAYGAYYVSKEKFAAIFGRADEM